MPADEIPEAVRRLIADRIDSVPELEAVLLLRRHRERTWTASDAAHMLYISVPVAAYVLELLTGRGFLSRSREGYRFEPSTAELETTVSDLDTTYARHLITVTNLIHSKPVKDVNELADAFRLRKEK